MKKILMPLIALAGLTLSGCALNPFASSSQPNPSNPSSEPNPSNPSSEPTPTTPGSSSETSSEISINDFSFDGLISTFLDEISTSNGARVLIDVDEYAQTTEAHSSYSNYDVYSSSSLSGSIDARFSGLTETNFLNVEGIANITDFEVEQEIRTSYDGQTQSQSIEQDDMAANFYLKSGLLYLDYNSALANYTKLAGSPLPENGKLALPTSITADFLSGASIQQLIAFYISQIPTSNNYVECIDYAYMIGTEVRAAFTLDIIDIMKVYYNVASESQEVGMTKEEFIESAIESGILERSSFTANGWIGIDVVKKSLAFDIEGTYGTNYQSGQDYETQNMEFDLGARITFEEQNITFPVFNDYIPLQ